MDFRDCRIDLPPMSQRTCRRKSLRCRAQGCRAGQESYANDGPEQPVHFASCTASPSDRSTLLVVFSASTVPGAMPPVI